MDIHKWPLVADVRKLLFLAGPLCAEPNCSRKERARCRSYLSQLATRELGLQVHSLDPNMQLDDSQMLLPNSPTATPGLRSRSESRVLVAPQQLPHQPAC
jgi:hypothetical protein